MPNIVNDHETHCTRVLFTPETFIRQQWGGVSNSFACIAAELSHLQWDVTVMAGFHGNRHLRESDVKVTGVYVGLNKNIPPTLKAVSRMWCRMLITLSKPQIIHDTNYWPEYARMSRKGPYVVNVQDMICEIYPEESGWSDKKRHFCKTAAELADAVLVPSYSTKNDLHRIWAIDPDKIFVAHLGVKKMEAAAWAAPDWPYVLYVGRRKGYKDFTTAIEAMARLRVSGWDGGIVCFGKKLTRSELEHIQHLGIPMDRVISDSGADAKLATIYAGALALIYPSRYEGFGMPILEAMAYGCPVLCSDTPACLEAAGGAAMVAPAGDANAFFEHLKRLASSDAVRAETIAAGLQRAKNQPWSACAHAYGIAYRYAWERFVEKARLK